MTRALVAIATPLSVLAVALAAPGTGARAATVTERPLALRPQPVAQQGPAQRPDASTRYGSGDGVNLDPLGTCVSCTNASAADNSSASESRELRIADESLAEGQGPSNGYTGGSAVSVPPNSLLGLALGSFQMDNHATRASSEAHSRGTLADLRPGEGQMGSVAVLESRSNATWSPAHGVHRDGTSNGLDAGLANGRMAVVVLHSDSSSEGAGHVYLVHVNDREVASAEQFGGGLPLSIPKVATVSVLHVGPGGAVVGGVRDGSSNEAADVVSSSADSPGDQH
jgi:hypothetical protein